MGMISWKPEPTTISSQTRADLGSLLYTEGLETMSIYSLFLHQEDCGVPGLTQTQTPSRSTRLHAEPHHPLLRVCLIWHLSTGTVYPAPILIRAQLIHHHNTFARGLVPTAAALWHGPDFAPTSFLSFLSSQWTDSSYKLSYSCL